jgi:hypothetical protein
MDNIYHIPVNTTFIATGGVCSLGRHVSTHDCHPQVLFLVTIMLSVLNTNFPCKPSGATVVL